MKRHAPAAERNRQPILEVLSRYLPDAGRVLEISSGTGQHVCWFARHHPKLHWHPSDPDPSARASVQAWLTQEEHSNIAAPIDLETSAWPWPVAAEVQPLDCVININMIHISPWKSCEGLMHGTEHVLKSGGILFMYGPYQIDGEHTAPSNQAFDASLRSRDPSWGVRDLAKVQQLAESHGLDYIEHVPMPANNFSVIYRKR